MPELSDSEKLRVLAAWFDMWDRPETDRQLILDDSRNPAHNDVQLDLLRIADEIASRASLDDAIRAVQHAVFRDHPNTDWCDGCKNVRVFLRPIEATRRG